MRDEYFELFIEEFGEATTRKEVPYETQIQWREKLPQQLLLYWRLEGWSTYKNGLFSIVNPDDYRSVVDEWLEGTPYIENDIYYVIARTAFGDLFLCGEKTGRNLKISCSLNTIFASIQRMHCQSSSEINSGIQTFFSSKEPSDCDIYDDSDNSLFDQALKKLGPLAESEIYGFVPALVTGGTADINNLQKLDYSIYLSILRQFAAPRIIKL